MTAEAEEVAEEVATADTHDALCAVGTAGAAAVGAAALGSGTACASRTQPAAMAVTGWRRRDDRGIGGDGGGGGERRRHAQGS